MRAQVRATTRRISRHIRKAIAVAKNWAKLTAALSAKVAPEKLQFVTWGSVMFNSTPKRGGQNDVLIAVGNECIYLYRKGLMGEFFDKVARTNIEGAEEGVAELGLGQRSPSLSLNTRSQGQWILMPSEPEAIEQLVRHLAQN
jgi:hypothetical protein